MLKDYLNILKDRALNSIINSYKSIGQVTKVELLKSCPDVVFMIYTVDSNYIVKFVKSIRSLELQYQYTEHISKSMHVQTIIKNDFNELYSQINILDSNYYMVVKKYLIGNKPDFSNLEEVFCFGESLGLLHSFSNNFTFDIDINIRTKNINLYINNIVNLITNSYSNIFIDTKKLDNFHKLIKSFVLKYSNEEFLIENTLIHGDISSGNSVILDGTVSFIDFDNFCYSNKWYDIGAFKWEISHSRKLDNDVWQVFLSGYESTYTNIINIDTLAIDYCLICKELEVITYYLDLSEYYGNTYSDKSFINNRIDYMEKVLNKYMEY